MVQVSAEEAARIGALEDDVAAGERDMKALLKSAAGLQKKAEALQAEIDGAGGEELVRLKKEVAALQEVRFTLIEFRSIIDLSYARGILKPDRMYSCLFELFNPTQRSSTLFVILGQGCYLEVAVIATFYFPVQKLYQDH